MATRTYIASAANIRHTATLVIGGTWLATETVTLTIDNVDVVITIGSLVTTAQVATTIGQAVNGTALTDTTAAVSPTIAQGGAQALGQFAGITASVSSSTVTFTADVAGVPFTISAAEGSTSGTINLTASATAATGQGTFTNQDNWSGNTAPVDDDAIYLNSGAQNIFNGLSPAIQPASFTKTKAYSGNIGLPEVNVDDEDKPYGEYRTKALTFDDNSVTCTYNLEGGTGFGSRLCRLAAGAGQAVFNIYGQATPLVSGVPCVLLSGSHSDNVVNNLNGNVGIAFYASEAMTLATLRTGNGVNSQARSICGPSATLSSCDVITAGGFVETRTAIDNVEMTGGVHEHHAGTIADLDVFQDGTFIPRGAFTITDFSSGSGGHFDKRHDLSVVTFTNKVLFYKGAKFSDPNGTCVFSAGYQFVGCREKDCDMDFGTNRSHTVT